MFDFDIRGIFLMIIPVLLALTVHEYAHALAAYRLGDNTAKNEGRLTLNPLAHLDPIGTLMLFLSKMIGWAKPVPFDPRNFKNPVRDITLVALAGPVSNFILAGLMSIALKVFYLLNIFSYIPGVGMEAEYIFHLAILVNVSLGIFNLLPVPPLDGFKVLSYFLPFKWVHFAYKNQMVFTIVFVALVLTGVLPSLIRPMVWTVFSLLS
ncbi:site-2 protease family protein [Deltaproteobacteria bacterium Smac51]|nr:site-2 protease family protein [Deltaproteobacteria bacterium Smac51]